MRRLRRSLGAKLLAAQLLVIVTGSATLAVIALALAPGLFREHVRRALGVVPADVALHLDEAFRRAFAVSLVVAVIAAAAAAGGAGWFLSRRFVRPVRELGRSAERIAQGHYAERVPVLGEDELGRLGEAFNELARSLETAEEQRRRLLSDLAHELRTPLATVDGYLEGLADGVVSPAPPTWALLRGETRRLGRLVDDLQKVARAEERQLDLRPEPTRPESIVQNAVAAAAPAFAAKDVRLEHAVEGGPAEVRIDRDRIAEVLANLLENALRHTPPGGAVTVTAASRGNEVELAVADTGEGIAAEHLPHLFERFYRADRARARRDGGSGIGLAIAQALVEAHGGRIRVQSEGPGCGARFTISLPSAA